MANPTAASNPQLKTQWNPVKKTLPPRNSSTLRAAPLSKKITSNATSVTMRPIKATQLPSNTSGLPKGLTPIQAKKTLPPVPEKSTVLPVQRVPSVSSVKKSTPAVKTTTSQVKKNPTETAPPLPAAPNQIKKRPPTQKIDRSSLQYGNAAKRASAKFTNPPPVANKTTPSRKSPVTTVHSNNGVSALDSTKPVGKIPVKYTTKPKRSDSIVEKIVNLIPKAEKPIEIKVISKTSNSSATAGEQKPLSEKEKEEEKRKCLEKAKQCHGRLVVIKEHLDKAQTLLENSLAAVSLEATEHMSDVVSSLEKAESTALLVFFTALITENKYPALSDALHEKQKRFNGLKDRILDFIEEMINLETLLRDKTLSIKKDSDGRRVDKIPLIDTVEIFNKKIKESGLVNSLHALEKHMHTNENQVLQTFGHITEFYKSLKPLAFMCVDQINKGISFYKKDKLHYIKLKRYEIPVEAARPLDDAFWEMKTVAILVQNLEQASQKVGAALTEIKELKMPTQVETSFHTECGKLCERLDSLYSEVNSRASALVRERKK